jgi:Uma2 family endonuclease
MGALMSGAPNASTPTWPTPPEGGWTADDLDRLPNLPPHTELIDGSLLFVGPRTVFHSRAVDFFKWQLQSLAPSEFEVIQEFTIDIDRQNRPEPDVIVVRGDVVEDPEQTRCPAQCVLLAIEVVSADSVSRDRETKPLKYARAGIPHYWRVENEKGLAAVHAFANRAARAASNGHGAQDSGPAPPEGNRAAGSQQAERQRTNTPACPARSRKYCGATPSTSVTATPTPIAVIVSGDGTATVGPSGRGSLKNISTMTRM